MSFPDATLTPPWLAKAARPPPWRRRAKPRGFTACPGARLERCTWDRDQAFLASKLQLQPLCCPVSKDWPPGGPEGASDPGVSADGAAPERPVPGVPRPQGPGTAGRAGLQRDGPCGRPQAGLGGGHQVVSGQHTLPFRTEQDKVPSTCLEAPRLRGGPGPSPPGHGSCWRPTPPWSGNLGPKRVLCVTRPGSERPLCGQILITFAKASMGLG